MNKKKSPSGRRNWSARAEGLGYYSKGPIPRKFVDRSKYTGQGELKKGREPGKRQEPLPELV